MSTPQVNHQMASNCHCAAGAQIAVGEVLLEGRPDPLELRLDSALGYSINHG